MTRGRGDRPFVSRHGAFAALAAFAAVELAFLGSSLDVKARHTAAVTAATAVCWTLEAMPLGAASLLPFALLPLLGVLPAEAVAAAYFDDTNFLFLGGMILGHALERWKLHRRLATNVVKLIGTSPRRLVLGFLLGTAFTSLWVSNTATAVMMAPIALAVLDTSGVGREEPGERAFGAALLLTVAYGSNIGGIGTPIGTGPNFAFFGQFSGGGAAEGLQAPSFLGWTAAMVPVVLALCLVAWVVLTRVTLRVPAELPKIGEGFRQVASLGPWSRPEVRIGIVFLAAVVLWITRSLRIGGEEFGWLRFLPRDLFGSVPRENAITNSTIAVAVALVAFVVPAGDGTGERLAGADAIRAVPWDMLLLLGGGFAIARAFTASKLSDALGAELGPLLGGARAGPLPLVVGLCLFVTFLSEVTSNTATALVMLPIAANLGRAAGVDPRVPMIAVALSASLAFMLPIGTPPNAIAFASRRIPMPAMVLAGLAVNGAAVLVSTAAILGWICPMLGIPT